LYGSLPFVERLAAAARDGFECVEFWVAPDRDATARELTTLGLKVAVINVDPGPAGDSAGRLSDPEQTDWWRREFESTLGFALRIGCPAINLLTGGRADLPRDTQVATAVDNLTWALTRTPDNVALLLEPLNRADLPDYRLHTVDDARTQGDGSFASTDSIGGLVDWTAIKHVSSQTATTRQPTPSGEGWPWNARGPPRRARGSARRSPALATQGHFSPPRSAPALGQGDPP
jgi:Xylose isomerase-like TIM barrel